MTPFDTTATAPAALSALQMAEVIKEGTARLCAERYGSRLRSVVVTGSVARDEATFVGNLTGRRLLGDAEFLLIFSDLSTLPAEGETIELSRRVEARLLAEHHLSGHIELSAGRAAYLTHLDPHIFALELRECGRVIWGDSAVLSLIPAFDATAIPLEDAWRLLANRIVEHLALATEQVGAQPGVSLNARYRTIKLYLDMATSLLLFSGAYGTTYRNRSEKLRALAESQGTVPGWPFPLRAFADRVALSTELKLGSGQMFGERATELLDWREAISYAHRLWRWELARLGRSDQTLDDRALMSRWMRNQPLPARARGWLYVARRAGWWQGSPHWPRWVRYGWRGSPRYWVYASASELLFRLPALMGSPVSRTAPPSRDLSVTLPVPNPGRGDATGPPWARLASAILWNYDQFLTGTRS
jgi:predicted nucleotidyltransferase